jgi:hypothetical protein
LDHGAWVLLNPLGTTAEPVYDKVELRAALDLYYKKFAPEKSHRIEPAMKFFGERNTYSRLLAKLEKQYHTAVDISPVETCRAGDVTCSAQAYLTEEEDCAPNRVPGARLYRLPKGCYLHEPLVTHASSTLAACREKCVDSSSCKGFAMEAGTCFISNAAPSDEAVEQPEIEAALSAIKQWCKEVRLPLEKSGSIYTEYLIWVEKLRAVNAKLGVSGCQNAENFFVKMDADQSKNKNVIIVMGDTRPLVNWEGSKKAGNNHQEVIGDDNATSWMPSELAYNEWGVIPDGNEGDIIKMARWEPTSLSGKFYKDTAFYTAAAAAAHLYAEKHGYEFLYYHFNHTVVREGERDLLWTPEGNRDCTWIKVLALKAAIRDRPDATHLVW